MASETTEKSNTPEIPNGKPTKPAPTIYSVKLGIWEIFFSSKPKSNSSFLKYVPSAATSVLEALSLRWLIVRMLKDMFALAPLHLIIHIIAELGQSLQGGAVMYCNSQILNEVLSPPFDSPTYC